MTVEKDLVDYLESELSVGTRVHPGKLPDAPVLPAVVYQWVSTLREVAYDGPIKPVSSRLQLDAWATRYSEARALAGEISTALLGYSGMMGATFIAVPRQDAEMDIFDDETGYYRVMSEFIIWHDD